MITKILGVILLIILSGSNKKNKFITELEKDISYLKNLYIDIHQNPEISLMEKQTSERLASELKKIANNVNQGVLKKNRKGILDNLRMAKEMKGAVGDDESDSDDENPACEKYPEACGSDNGGFPAPVTGSRYDDALRG